MIREQRCYSRKGLELRISSFLSLGSVVKLCGHRADNDVLEGPNAENWEDDLGEDMCQLLANMGSAQENKRDISNKFKAALP